MTLYSDTPTCTNCGEKLPTNNIIFRGSQWATVTCTGTLHGGEDCGMKYDIREIKLHRDHEYAPESIEICNGCHRPIQPNAQGECIHCRRSKYMTYSDQCSNCNTVITNGESGRIRNGYEVVIAGSGGGTSVFSFTTPLLVDKEGRLNPDAVLLLYSLSEWASWLQRKCSIALGQQRNRTKMFSGARKFYQGLRPLREQGKVYSSPKGKGRIWLFAFLAVAFFRVFVLGKRKEN